MALLYYTSAKRAIFEMMTRYLFVLLLMCSALPLSAQRTEEPYVLVLGVAQDGGYPHLGCMRQCCVRAWQDESMRRYVVSIALVDPKARKWWLFDATPDMKYQLHYFQQLTNGAYPFLPNGIFITHAHIGHYTGLMDLGKEVMSTHDVPVYALPRLKAYLETNGPWSQLVSLHNIKLVELKEDKHQRGGDEALHLGDHINVFTFKVPHRDEYSETAGFEIVTAHKKYLFIPDINKWGLWDRNITDEVKRVDVAMVDATFFDSTDLPGRNLASVPHPLVVETMRIFEKENKDTRAKVHFIHFNHTNPLLWDDEKQKLVERSGFNFAKQGEKL